MFETLARVPDDPLLGITAAFRKDASSAKVDLGVGVYKDESGNTPVPAAVRAAEQQVLAAQATKTYLSPIGNPGFNAQVLELALGADHAGRKGEVVGVQAPGGSGALRLGAELLKTVSPGLAVHVSDPTWANHVPLLSGAGLKLEKYPYYDSSTHSVRLERMLSHFDALPPRSVVLLHASCHNPTGQDLDASQWEQVADVVRRRELLPFIDSAYQGLGVDLEADAAPLRLFAQRVPEALMAISCSKNFGLYRERTGLLVLLAQSAERASIGAGQLGRLARTIYSMPPDHGAAIVDRVLAEPQLRRSWTEELAGMARRINELRALLAEQLNARLSGRSFDWIRRQRGMFSRIEMAPERVVELRERHHVYIAPDGRVNVAGISPRNVEHVADAFAAVLA